MEIEPNENTSYELLGWDIDGDGIADSIPATSLIDIEAYPVIGEKERTHTVTFCDNKGNIIQSQTLPYGTVISLPADPDIKGYTFVSWEGYTEGMTVTDDIKIYANMEHVEGGHTYVTTTVKPGCTEQGYDEHKCSICDDTYRDNYTEATGHNFGEWTVTKEATCTETGLQQRVCITCKHTEEEILETKLHEFDAEILEEATCTQKGKAKNVCKHCQHEVIEEIPENTHRYEKAFVDLLTMERLLESNIDMFYTYEDGKAVIFKCADCGHIKTIKEEELSHSMSATSMSQCSHAIGDWQIMVEVSCEEDGIDTRMCALCGEVIEIRIYQTASGHVYDDDNDMECNECGYKKYVRGDANADNAVTSDDAVYLLRHIFMPAFYELNQSGDMDGDGDTDIDDAIYLLRHTFMPQIYPLAK